MSTQIFRKRTEVASHVKRRINSVMKSKRKRKRTFGGKKFTWIGNYNLNGEATLVAEEARNLGWNARVIKASSFGSVRIIVGSSTTQTQANPHYMVFIRRR